MPVCGHTASITLHKDGVLFDDAKFDLIHNMSTKHPFNLYGDSGCSINREDRRRKREDKDICDRLVVLLMHCDTWLGGNSGWVACDSSESGVTRCLLRLTT